jgi:hypothetical protein
MAMQPSSDGCLSATSNKLALADLKYMSKHALYVKASDKSINGTISVKVCGDKAEIRSKFANVEKVTIGSVSEGRIEHLISLDPNEKIEKENEILTDEQAEALWNKPPPADGTRVTEKLLFGCSLPLKVQEIK